MTLSHYLFFSFECIYPQYTQLQYFANNYSQFGKNNKAFNYNRIPRKIRSKDGETSFINYSLCIISAKDSIAIQTSKVANSQRYLVILVRNLPRKLSVWLEEFEQGTLSELLALDLLVFCSWLHTTLTASAQVFSQCYTSKKNLSPELPGYCNTQIKTSSY